MRIRPRLAVSLGFGIGLLAFTGCRGASGALARALGMHVGRWLVQLGIVREGTMFDIGLAIFGAGSFFGFAIAALCYYDDVRGRGPAWATASRTYARFVAWFLVLGGISCGVLFFGGMAAERSHWLGAGACALFGFGFMGSALVSERWHWRVLQGAAGLAGLIAMGWCLSEPPTEERIASNRIAARGLDVDWERLGDGERHAVSVRFEDFDDEELKKGEVDSVLAELQKMPHLKRVSFGFRVKSVPAGTFDKLRQGLPGVNVMPPLDQMLRDIENRGKQRPR